MSELTACVGAPLDFTHRDKTYQVSLITQAVKAAFEKAQFARAREAAAALRDLMTKDEYREHIKLLSDDYLSGEYGLESERGLAFAQTSKGTVLLCSLLFGVGEDEMTRLLVERKDDVVNLMSVVIAESFGTLPEAKP